MTKCASILTTTFKFEQACERVDYKLYTSLDSEVHIRDYLETLKHELGL